ncbi:hypothetical protein LTR50_006894 [Elasticomyces elasticus]|nr:hypothetical protein LTR50_006894 [Elasticomyces elasticus]
MSQEEQTEQPGYVRSWAEGTYAIQIPPIVCAREGMTPRAFQSEIGYDTPRVTSDSGEDRIDTDSDSFMWTEYSETTPDWDPSGEILTPMKNEYIERLLRWHLYAASDQDQSNDSSGSRSEQRQTSSPSSNNSGNSPTRKRKGQLPDHSRDRDHQSGDDDENDQLKSPSVIGEDGQGNGLPLACPFVKRYPHRYLKCYGHQFKDVSRVKFHVCRDKAHRLPLYCCICSATFATEHLRDEHGRAATCTLKPLAKWEGITASQRQQLGKRSPPASTVMERYNAVYRILFPGDPLPSSPYVDSPFSSTELRDFREHQLSQGPVIWNEILRTRLPEHLLPHLEELRSLHHFFYPEAVARLYDRWSSRNPTTDSVQSQLSSNPRIQQGAGPTVDPIGTTAIPASSSPLRSDSALSDNVAGSSRNGNEPIPGSSGQNGFFTPQVRQQQATMQCEPQHIARPHLMQGLSHVQNQTPQIPSLMPIQHLGNPSNATYPYVTSGQIDQGNPQLIHQWHQTPSFTPPSGQESLGNAQYVPGYPGQTGSGIPQLQYQQPQAGLYRGDPYQQHYMQVHPGFPYHVPAPLPPTSVFGFRDDLDAQHTYRLINNGTESAFTNPSAGLPGAQPFDSYMPTGGYQGSLQM